MAPKCEACGKTDVPLKQCAKCKSVQYCNRDCQKGDWKTHKRTCTFLAAAIGTEASEPSRSKRSDSKPFTAIFHGNFLHDRSKEDTYKILIDVVRMRQQDCLKLEGTILAGSIHAGQATSEEALRDFVRKAQEKTNFLPGWWNDEATQACVQHGSGDGRFSLAAKPDKDSIQRAWVDSLMPMKLRMIGEKVYGNTPGMGPGPTSESMLMLQMTQESGTGFPVMSHFGLDLGA